MPSAECNSRKAVRVLAVSLDMEAMEEIRGDPSTDMRFCERTDVGCGDVSSGNWSSLTDARRW